MLPRNHPDRIQIAFGDHRLVANAGLIDGAVEQVLLHWATGVLRPHPKAALSL